MKEFELGFIGTGNMAKALIKGILNSNLYKPDKIIASDIKKEQIDRVQKEFNIKVAKTNKELVKKAKTIFLCIKPQNMEDVLNEIKDEVDKSQLIISIAAGVPIDAIKRWLNKDVPIIRVMPNTPAIVKEGMSAISYSLETKKEHINIVLDIFNSVGKTIIVEEEKLDLITALSGSGPGFIFRIMEAMVNASLKLGLKEEDAKMLVIQTFIGASYLARESKEPLSKLREMVTSPGGTTEAGLFVMEKNRIEQIIYETIFAAYNRSLEIKNKWRGSYDRG